MAKVLDVKKMFGERETVKHRHKVIKKMKGCRSATYMKNIHKSYKPMANTEKAIKLKSNLCIYILHKKMQAIFKILKENSPP